MYHLANQAYHDNPNMIPRSHAHVPNPPNSFAPILRSVEYQPHVRIGIMLEIDIDMKATVVVSEVLKIALHVRIHVALNA